MNAAARKAYERDARLTRWAAWAGMALVGLVVAAALPLALGTWWLAASLFLSM